MKIYYIEGYWGWHLVKAENERRARADGNREYGRGNVVEVRPATEDEIKYYIGLKGEVPEVRDRY